MKDLQNKMQAQEEAKRAKIEAGRRAEAERQKRGGRHNIFIDEKPIDFNKK